MDRLPVSRWRLAAGVLVSAALCGVYAYGGYAWILGFVALVPWLLVLDTVRTARGALLAGALMSVAFAAAVFGWFGAAVGAYTGVGAVAGVLALLILAPLMQPQLIAFALVRHLVGRRHGALLRALAGAAAWVACEWLWPKLLGDTLGHGVFPSATLRQVADLGGAAGITVALLLVNEAIAAAVMRRRGGLRGWLRPLAPAALLLLAMVAYGTTRLSTLQVPPDQDAPAIRVAMVQASITDYEGLRREIGAYGVVRQVLDTHYALSWSAIRDHGADVLLWTETVYPTPFGHPRSEDGAALDREIQGFVDAAGVPLVFGTYDIDEAGEYNAAAFLEPGAGVLGTYRKTHPFPLTEHVPDWLDGPLLRRLLPWAGTWRAGTGARVMPLRTADGREVNVLPLICLDDVHSALAIDGARLGAQAIVGMSNDSWFTDYPVGARLHLAVAAFRSIETRLPQVRVTTNGLSAIIDDTGEVLARTEIGTQSVLTAYLSAQDPRPTLMVRWGDWVGKLGLAFVLVLAALAALAALRAAQARHASDEAPAFAGDVSVLAPQWRIAAGLLRTLAAAGLLWLALDMLLRTGLQVQSLDQLRVFAFVVLLPLLAAWAMGRTFSAKAGVADGLLVLDQRHRRIEIPVASIAALQPWTIPLPQGGVHLQLASGQRWPHGVSLADPLALQRALAAAGSPARIEAGVPTRLAGWAHARAATIHRWLDHGVVKFVLFPMLPAAVAFRLHQMIAYGGPFGEYYTYGLKAWLTGALIWWASWALGLMLFAAAMRLVIEIVTALALPLSTARATDARDAVSWLARVVYYLGVPAWLAFRLLSG